jgi:hypothetical protein
VVGRAYGACVAGICALQIVACGGAARDPRDQAPDPIAGESDEVPEAQSFEFPPGGVCVPGVREQRVRQLVVERSGALWLRVDDGVVAISEGSARRYDARNSPLPGVVENILVDAQDRKWFASQFYDGKIVMLEGNEWHTVLQDTSAALIGVSANGVAWVQRRRGQPSSDDQQLFVQAVTPTFGELIALPSSYGPMNTDHDGAVWLFGSEGAFRWAGDAWKGPLATGLQGLAYDPRQDVLAAQQGNSLRIVSWADSGIEERVVRGAEQGQFIGFAPGLRQVWQDDREVRWIQDGTVVDTLSLPSALPASLGPDGRIYLATLDAIYEQNGDQLERILTLVPPDSYRDECR